MPRGFQKDLAATRDAYARGLLIDVKRRSFISQPKAIPGECETPQPHLLLYGADKTAQRMKLFQRENNRCEVCNSVLSWGGEESYGDPFVGEWMHLRDKPWNKCDCPINASLRCHEHHQGSGTAHYARRPRFGPQKVAV